MRRLLGVALFLKSKKAKLMRFWGVQLRNFSLLNKFLIGLTTHISTVSKISPIALINSTQKYMIKDIHILPSCTLQLYKDTFINRCLFGYIVS